MLAYITNIGVVLDRLIDTTAVSSDVDRDTALAFDNLKAPHDPAKIQTEFCFLPDSLLQRIFDEELAPDALRKNEQANELDIKITLLERQEQAIRRGQDSTRARIDKVAVNLGITNSTIANKKLKVISSHFRHAHS